MWPNKRAKIMAAATAVMDNEVDNFGQNILLLVPHISQENFNLQFIFCLEDDQHIRTPGFYEKWLDKYLEYDFYKHFRMTRDTFYYFILPKVGVHYEEPVYRGGAYKPIPIDKSLLIFLWHFSKADNLETVSDKFNVCVKTTFYCMEKIMVIFKKIVKDEIKWPTQREARLISQEFQQISNFPGVIGAIDGCHFQCTVPKVQHDSYQDRNFNHSITLQGICQPNLKLINISTGYPGSLHDARILRESNIYNEVEDSEPNFFYNKYHLLGDSAYPCKTWLLTPFRNPSNQAEKNYNFALSQSRVRIEHTFGMMKNRWPILKFINVYSIKKVTNIILACCVLHNLCLDNNDYYNEEDIEEEDDDDEQYYPDDRSGTDKRNRIALSMFA